MSKDSVVHAIVTADTLREYMAVPDTLVSECKLHLSDEGFHISAVDPANVGLVEYADLSPQAMEYIEAPGQVTIGLNIDRFLDMIKPADGDTLVDLSVDMETRHLEIEYGQTSTSMALIDPDAIREEPDSPDLDLPNTVVLEGEKLSHAVTVAEMMSDHITISGDTDGRSVVFESKGDTDEANVEYGQDDTIDVDIAESTGSIFSLEYLAEMVTPIPPNGEVTIQFGEEFPMRIRWVSLDGELDVGMMLAPRIRST